MEFTEEQHKVWRTLYARQLPQVHRFACREYLEGFDVLDLPPDRIPALEELNAVITPRTGWRLRRTPVRYSDAVPWYRHFARRMFLITDYMRAWEELDFTPEPDMFHDLFGHLPFMTLPRYTALQDLFAAPFLRAGPLRREHIKRLAWFSTEFGLIHEEGELKILGAGILSSLGETRHVMSGRVPVLPFSVENVITHTKAIYSFNEVLFVVDSLEALRAELSAYFDSIPDERPSDEAALSAAGEALEDWELADLRDAPRADPSASG
jgi:phenylalanine-4-hydroxylase